MIYGEHAACAAKPCHDFIGDEKKMVAFGDLSETLDKGGRRNSDTASPLNRFKNNRPDRPGVRFSAGAQKVIDVLQLARLAGEHDEAARMSGRC